MAGCMGMLLIDAVIYGILMWSVIVLYMFVFSLALALSSSGALLTRFLPSLLSLVNDPAQYFLFLLLLVFHDIPLCYLSLKFNGPNSPLPFPPSPHSNLPPPLLTFPSFNLQPSPLPTFFTSNLPFSIPFRRPPLSTFPLSPLPPCTDETE